MDEEVAPPSVLHLELLPKLAGEEGEWLGQGSGERKVNVTCTWVYKKQCKLLKRYYYYCTRFEATTIDLTVKHAR